MLSYRHLYHAGNFADVLKHIIVAEILQYLGRKDKPFDYIDSHSGAGVYSLTSSEAAKTGEYRQGIALLMALDWPELANYLEVIKKYNPEGDLAQYPGSPAFAMHYLRAQDRGWLFELHTADFPRLQQFAGSFKRIQVRHADGFAGVLAQVPPGSRRALVLMDPSYEVKSDFEQVIDVVSKAHAKFATGIYALWYPVVRRRQIDWFERQFRNGSLRNIQVYELGVRSDSDSHGMTSSCMMVINPPWGLAATMQSLLPRLAEVLGQDGQGFSRIETLKGE
jgi:23S rRNA (adenine2030-N6)-methyltransferase